MTKQVTIAVFGLVALVCAFAIGRSTGGATATATSSTTSTGSTTSTSSTGSTGSTGSTTQANASTTTAAAQGHDMASMNHSMQDAATPTAVDDDKGLALLANGEMSHGYGPDQPLDGATRLRLAHQLALTRLVADRFPTLKDAEAAGSKAAGAFDPGLGIHMGMPAVNIAIPAPMAGPPPVNGELSDEQLVHPSTLLYDGTTPDARLAGFMYVSMSPDEPVGFAGPNDHWHTHGKLCLKMGGADGIKTIHNPTGTAEACQAAGGYFVERTTYMVHVWTIPGYESNRGVFSDINPALTCSDGTYYTVPEQERDGHQINHCRADAQ